MAESSYETEQKPETKPKVKIPKQEKQVNRKTY